MKERSTRRPRVVASSLLSIVLSCDNTPTVCTSIGAFAITAVVRDASTAGPAAFGATLVARDGAFADSATGLYSGSDERLATHLNVALDRPGTYDVTVRKAGYQSWTRQGVRVEQGECRVEGRTLDVRLILTTP